jgi:HEAT repeat protein
MGFDAGSDPATPAPDRGERRALPRDLPGLIAALERPSDETRRRAALDLAGSPEAVAVLAAHLAVEPSRAVREAIVVALVETGGETVAHSLVPHLRSENAAVRNLAVGALAQLEATAALVPDLLADADVDVRVMCVTMLASLHDQRVPGWLRQVIERDQDANVCGVAVDVLAEVAGPDMSDALEALPARFPDDPFLAFAVQLALARLGEAAA